MFGETFYHEVIRKAVIAFGTLFNEVYLVRKDRSGKQIEKIKVPLTYAPKQKAVVRQTQDPNVGIDDKQVAIVYPRMSFFMPGLNYDGSRHLVSTGQIVHQEGNVRKKVYNPAPYILDFELYIVGKNQDDVIQLVERILPYFTPKFTVTMRTIEELNVSDDFDIVLQSTAIEDPYDGNIAERRDIVATLKFTVSVYLYGRMIDQKIIRKVQIDLLVPFGKDINAESIATTPRSARITTLPDPINADPNDDFGFSTSIEEFDDNLKYDPESGEDRPIEGSDNG